MSSKHYITTNRLSTGNVESNGHAPTRARTLPASTPAPMQPLTVLTLMRGLRRCWKSALILGAMFAAGFAAFIWITLPPQKPSAYVKLFLPTSDRGLVYEHPDAALTQQTHKQLLLSRLVVEPTIEKEEVKSLESVRERPDPVMWLSREMNVFFDGPEIVGIKLFGDRPEELKVILDTLTTVYLSRIANRAAEDRENRRKHLEKARREANEELKKIQNKLQEEAKAGGSADRQLLVLEHKGIMEVMGLAVRRRSEIQGELQKLKTEQIALQTRNPALLVILSTQIEEGVDLDPAIISIRAQIKTSRLKLDEILKKFSPEYEEAKNLTREIEKYETREKTLRIEAGPRVEKSIRERQLTNAKSRLEELVTEIAAQEKSLKAGDEEVASHQKAAAALASSLWTVEGSRIELLQAEEKVRAVENSYQKLTVDYNSPPRVSVLEEAIIERVNDSARRMKLAIMAGIAGFGMALLLRAFLEYRTNRFSTVDEITGLELPVLGDLRPNRSLLSFLGSSDAQSARGNALEAIETMRIMLVHQTDSTGERVIQITSAQEGEGRGYLACQLAMSLARAGRRVLLIDGNLRQPNLHREFQLPLSPGLNECLADQQPNPNSLKPTSTENLTLLPAGVFETKSLFGLNQGALGSLLRELREHFDYILLDSGGLLSHAESLQMATQVDAVLLTLRRDYSRLDPAHEAKQRLLTLNIPLLGAVVT